MNITSTAKLAAMVRNGNATVEGVTRDDQGGRHLIVRNDYLRITEHDPGQD